jgi:hypothetical protein
MPEIPNRFNILNVLDVSPQKVHWGKIGASGRPEDWSASPSPGFGELNIQVVWIGQPTKASQRRSLHNINGAYPKLMFFCPILNFESFRYV